MTGRAVRESLPEQSARYTPPVPRKFKKSPLWMGITLMAILVAGVLMIILNYVSVLPASPTNWYLLGGIGLLFVGAMMATRYH